MRKALRKIFLSFWTLWSVILLTAAVPQQSILENIPWWVWLLVIAVLLLIMFGLVLAVDVRSTRNKDNGTTD